jgi:small redox-active disulfide protein 1
MMEFLLELFTSPTCPYCPAAKRVAENVVKQMEGAILIERDVSLPENAEAAARYRIQGVPTLIVNGKYQITGVPGSEPELYSHLQKMK